MSKGSKQRPTNTEAYSNGYDRIFRQKSPIQDAVQGVIDTNAEQDRMWTKLSGEEYEPQYLECGRTPINKSLGIKEEPKQS